jgi:hypothetical protein
LVHARAIGIAVNGADRLGVERVELRMRAVRGAARQRFSPSVGSLDRLPPDDRRNDLSRM